MKLKDRDFTVRQRSFTFPEPVESDSVIWPRARDLLHDLRGARRIGARLIGVGLSNLVDRDRPTQMGLFPDAPHVETDRDRTLHRTVDALRDRFGAGAVLPGRIVPEREGDGAAAPDEESMDGREYDP